jgi:hypothetical protein
MAFTRGMRVLVAVTALSFAVGAWAQTPAAPSYAPQVGQPGKDVVWVPTAQQLVDRMLDMAGVTAADYVIDLGSGDGRTVITAARRGTRALGIEYNPDLVELSRRNAIQAGVADRASFVKADIFQSDFSAATVLTLFLLPDLNLRLRPLILDMKPGTRVVSNTFTMGDWAEDQRVNVDNVSDCKYWCTGYLWIVPAKVEGRWTSAAGTLNLKTILIADGRLRGDQLTFRAGGADYSGKVAGNRIEGFATAGSASKPWSATKAP